MTKEEAIEYLDGMKIVIPICNELKELTDERNEAIDMAIESLSEPINCVKCKHYYETEDDTGVHGYCRMDTAHTDLISRAYAIEAVAEEWLSEASAESPYVNDDDIGEYRKRYRVSEYTDFSLGDGLPYCRWVVREGNGTPYWAMTTCKRGFNPLTKVRHVGEIKKVYDGCYCPICGRPIKTSGYVFDDDFEESEDGEE